MHTSDMTKIIVAFRNFANALKSAEAGPRILPNSVVSVIGRSIHLLFTATCSHKAYSLQILWETKSMVQMNSYVKNLHHIQFLSAPGSTSTCSIRDAV